MSDDTLRVMVARVDAPSTDHAQIGHLVETLAEAGEVMISVAFKPDAGVFQFRVEWRDEFTQIVAWNDDLLAALRKTDADVSAIANYG